MAEALKAGISKATHVDDGNNEEPQFLTNPLVFATTIVTLKKICKLLNSGLNSAKAGRFEKLMAKGKQHVDGETKIIDLLNPKEQGRYDGLEADPGI